MEHATVSAGPFGRVALRVRFEPQLNQLIRDMGARWSHDDRAWIFPATLQTARMLTTLFGPGLDARGLAARHLFSSC